MADKQIEANVGDVSYSRMVRGGTFWVSTTVGYCIYLDSNYDLVYNKTSNGGATWGGATELVAAGSCDCAGFDCWADWQTDGDAGTKIHVAYQSLDTEELRYVYLDTSGDSVGGDDLIVACAGSGTYSINAGLYYNMVSITKTMPTKVTGNQVQVLGMCVETTAKIQWNPSPIVVEYA